MSASTDILGQATSVPAWFSVLWALMNLAIFLSYVYIAAAIVPTALWRLRTKIAGTAFFATCGMTHFEMVYHLIYFPWATVAATTFSTHMLLVHLAQSLAVMFFCVTLTADTRQQAKYLKRFHEEHERERAGK